MALPWVLKHEPDPHPQWRVHGRLPHPRPIPPIRPFPQLMQEGAPRPSLSQPPTGPEPHGIARYYADRQNSSPYPILHDPNVSSDTISAQLEVEQRFTTRYLLLSTNRLYHSTSRKSPAPYSGTVEEFKLGMRFPFGEERRKSMWRYTWYDPLLPPPPRAPGYATLPATNWLVTPRAPCSTPPPLTHVFGRGILSMTSVWCLG